MCMFTSVAILIVFIIMLGYYLRCNNAIKSTLLGTSSGIVSLGIVGIISSNLLNLNVFVVCISAIAGVPGVLTLILLNKFLIL